MEAIFLKVLNMSITASYVILAVLLLRLALRRAPRKYSYALWAVVGFRLCCPISFSSFLSLFNLGLFDFEKAQNVPGQLSYIPADIAIQRQPEVTVGIPFANALINDSLPVSAMGDGANPLQVWQFVGTVLWCAGMAIILLYSILCDIRLRLRLRSAMRLEGNIWQNDTVVSPFIHGVLKPRIYIPFGLTEVQRQCVLQHERCHLKRFDHVAKLAAFLLLMLHWFNPLVWLAFFLFSRDMEMSCDEAVLRHSTNSTDYSETLLSIAGGHRFSLTSPLAFGETDVKRRIVNALRWKKPGRIVTLICILLCLIAVVICAANPVSGSQNETSRLSYNEEELGFQFGISYVTDECTYMSPLSSVAAINGDSGRRYYFLEDSFVIEYKKSGSREVINGVKWEWEDISDSRDQRLIINDRYYLLRNEQGLYIVTHYVERNGKDMIWDTYHLTPEGSNGGENTLDSAIRQAIRVHNADIHTDSLITGHLAVSYVILAQENWYEDRLEHETGDRTGSVTVYMLAMYGEYTADDNGIHEVVSNYTPAALTFAHYEDIGYVPVEYWTPEESNLEVSLREKFPNDSSVEHALNQISYMTALKQDQYRQAIEYWDFNTDAYLSATLEYLHTNSVTFRETVYYGTYALDYCFREFLSGNLEGMKAERMVSVCQEIMASMGEAVLTDGDVSTPEAWFRELRENALNLSRQYSMDALQKQYPASYLLLRLMEE